MNIPERMKFLAMCDGYDRLIERVAALEATTADLERLKHAHVPGAEPGQRRKPGRPRKAMSLTEIAPVEAGADNA